MVLLYNNQNKTDMKKLIPILFVVAVLAACQKEPSLSKLDDDYVVFTDYDKSADFGEYLTYYMPDIPTTNSHWDNRRNNVRLQYSLPVTLNRHLLSNYLLSVLFLEYNNGVII